MANLRNLHLTIALGSRLLINMDGTALYQNITTLFITQTFGYEMSITSTILVMVTIVAASIGTPAIPAGGVAVLTSALQSVGILTKEIVIIIGVERGSRYV